MDNILKFPFSAEFGWAAENSQNMGSLGINNV